MKKYECVKDYHPLLRNKATRFYHGSDPVERQRVREHNESIELVPTKDPIVVKGDVMYQKGSVFQSTLDSDCALYEHTLQEYKDCFKLIK